MTLCDGYLDVWFLTYTSKITGLMYTALTDILIPKNQWYVSSNQYTDIAGCVVDVELTNDNDDTPIEASALYTWFHAKTGDYLTDYNLFMQIMPHEFIAVLHEDGFKITRPKLPEAPEITQQVVPDLNSPLEKNGKSKTGKSTRKRSKSVS